MNYEQNNDSNNESADYGSWNMDDAPDFNSDQEPQRNEKLINLKLRQLEKLQTREPQIEPNRKLIENVPNNLVVTSVGEQSFVYKDANGNERIASNFPNIFKKYGLGNPQEEFNDPAFAESFTRMINMVINIDATQGKVLEKDGAEEACNEVVKDYAEKSAADGRTDRDRQLELQYRNILTHFSNSFELALTRSNEYDIKQELVEAGYTQSGETTKEQSTDIQNENNSEQASTSLEISFDLDLLEQDLAELDDVADEAASIKEEGRSAGIEYNRNWNDLRRIQSRYEELVSSGLNSFRLEHIGKELDEVRKKLERSRAELGNDYDEYQKDYASKLERYNKSKDALTKDEQWVQMMNKTISDIAAGRSRDDY